MKSVGIREILIGGLFGAVERHCRGAGTRPFLLARTIGAAARRVSVPAGGRGVAPGIGFLHGCGGLISRSTGWIDTREVDWAARGAAIFVQAYPGAYHDFDWPELKRNDRPEFTTAGGVRPITGTDPAARADALQRVPVFLASYLSR
jgi:hypothetical protein